MWRFYRLRRSCAGNTPFSRRPPTATTAVGVVPMMLGGSTFWAPVGVTIFAGGIGSLILVVTILPVLYSKIYK